LISLAITLFIDRRALPVARVITGVVGIVSFFALFGYFYDIPAWYEIEPHAPTTLQTAVGFVLLVLACIFAFPTQGLMAILSSDTDGGALARRFLPAALVMPFLIGWLRILGEEHGLYGEQIGDALSAMVLIAFFFGLVVFQVRRLYRSETARRETERQLQESRNALVQMNADLEHKVRERTARLQETVGDLEHFSYSITHDMRSPLRAMQGFGQLLQESPLAQKDPERDYIRRIVTSAERMDNLIRDALNYSKVVRQEMNLAQVDPTRVLREMVDTYPDFQPPKAEIEIAGPFPAVRANEAGLTQCFSNLLGNAVKFVEPGKVAHVRVWAKPLDEDDSDGARAVRIFVEDNGIGIPRDAGDRIFGMFQRLNKQYEGTGIGLSMVRKVAERMGGRVGFDSEPGHGSRFWLDLQIAA
jgi:signal transduction histidine kinase